ncbi:MAG: crossover junction endodeoxyribonuclease RuvC [Candidatus Peregrinibacteria bacterium]|nr:crossover junction endodeoxyribonuclease RuvC [Candidatus Peregrinibacteria bacterium]
MRILGIDPGLATIGFGVIDMNGHHIQSLDYGHISTSKNLPNSVRLTQIAIDLEEICKTWTPDVCAIEELFFSKNVTSAMQVSEARGVILQTLNRSGYPIIEYKPQQIKLAVTGDGRASKPQMQKMVALILKLKEIPKPDDAADALAIALCHAHTCPALQPQRS